MDIRRLLKSLAIIVLGLLILVGCDKPEPTVKDVPTEEEAQKELLTEHDWYLRTFEITKNGSTTSMGFGTCNQDDILRLSRDNRAEYKFNVMRCKPDDADVQCSWTLLDNNTRLSLPWPPQSSSLLPAMEYEIVALTDTKLQLAGPNPLNAAERYVYTFSTSEARMPDKWLETKAMLTAKRWRLTAHNSSFNQTPTDEYAQLGACQQDNLLQFNPDQTIIIDEGATKCNSADPQTRVAMWSMNYDGYTLLAPYGLLSSDYNSSLEMPSLIIMELTSTTLRLGYNYYSRGYGGSREFKYTAF
jgi:hypothetical protein